MKEVNKIIKLRLINKNLKHLRYIKENIVYILSYKAISFYFLDNVIFSLSIDGNQWYFKDGNEIDYISNGASYGYSINGSQIWYRS